MNERYGNVPVSQIRDAFNNLRRSIHALDVEAALEALETYEPFADYIFSARKEIEHDANGATSKD